MARWTEQTRDDFLAGFATATGFPRNEAVEQWAGFSRQLSHADLRTAEAGGYEAGQEQGQAFIELYPTTGEEA